MFTPENFIRIGLNSTVRFGGVKFAGEIKGWLRRP